MIGLCMATSASYAAPPLTITSVGSDTLGSLMLRWAIAFEELHPDVHVQIQTPGSASASLALSSGAADLGPMSRPMTAQEEQHFRERQGYAPLHVQVALDAVAVFVHPDNPLNAIRIAQLDGIYAADLRCAAATDLATWSDLGVTTSLAARPLLAIGRNTASGSYEYFREVALCNGDYRAQVVQFPGAAAIVAAVAQQPAAIGYAGIGHVSGLVKVLAVASDANQAAIAPDRESIRSGRYPLSRPLYIYFNQASSDARGALARQFLRFALSDAGQSLLRNEGLVPIAAEDLPTQRRIVE